VGGHPLSQPSARDPRWVAHGADNNARFQVPTLRNVDKRPDPSFVKAYGHNGYFKSLKEIVHFYNTRDTLASLPGGRCRRANDLLAGTGVDEQYEHTLRRALGPDRRR